MYNDYENTDKIPIGSTVGMKAQPTNPVPFIVELPPRSPEDLLR